MPGNGPVTDTILFPDKCSSGNSSENTVSFVNRFVGLFLNQILEIPHGISISYLDSKLQLSS